MKNTLNEILSMMSRIDPSYVYEDGEGEEQENKPKNGLGFTIGGHTYFPNKDIYAERYSDKEDFTQMAELILNLNNGNLTDLEDVTTGKKTYNNDSFKTINKTNSDGTLAYTIKYVIWGIIGNLNNPRTINEDLDFNEPDPYDISNYGDEIEFSTGVNNYKEILKIYLSSLMLDFLVDKYNDTETPNNIRYAKFKRGIDELLKLSGEKEKAILYILTNDFVNGNNDKVFVEFNKMLNLISRSSHKEDTKIANAFLKEQWTNLVYFINDYLNKRNQFEKKGEKNTGVQKLSTSEIKAINDGVVSVNLCCNGNNGKNMGVNDKKSLPVNINFIAEKCKIVSDSFKTDNPTKPSKTINKDIMLLKSLSYLRGISSFIAILSRYSTFQTEIQVLNEVITTKNLFIRSVEDFMEATDYVSSYVMVENCANNVISACNTLNENAGNIKRAADSIVASQSNTEINKDNIFRSKEEVSLFDVLTDDDFYILNRGMLADLYAKIKTLKDVGFNSVRYSSANMTMSSRVYQGQLRYAFAGPEYSRLRSFLYYISNSKNYSDEFRDFLYGIENIFTESDDAVSLSQKSSFAIDDPCLNDAKTSKEIYKEIRDLLINRFKMEAGNDIKKQWNIVDKIKGWLQDKKAYGKSELNSASQYDHIQDTLLYIIRNSDMQDRIRSANMLNEENRSLMRSFELLFSKKDNSYDIIDRLSPVRILECEKLNENNIKEIFGVNTPEELKKALPNGGLYVYRGNEVMNNATIVDAFAGSHKSFDLEDKDKTNSEILFFCNDVATSYLREKLPQTKPENTPLTESINISNNDFQKLYNQLKFQRELNRWKESKCPEIKSLLGNLSVDIGNQTYKIAIEYQGEQHFVGEGRQSPLQEKVRCDEFSDNDTYVGLNVYDVYDENNDLVAGSPFDTKEDAEDIIKKLKIINGRINARPGTYTRFNAFERRRKEYIKFIQDAFKDRRNSNSINTLTDMFFINIIKEFYECSKKKKDKYGIPIPQNTIDNLGNWANYANITLKNLSGKKEDLKRERIKGEWKDAKEKANSLERWEAEIDSWYQQLKDNAKVAKLSDIKKYTDEGKEYDDSWLFIQLVPKKYQECLHINPDKMQKLQEKCQNNPNEMTNDEKRLYVRYLIWEKYYGGQGFNFYAFSRTGKKHEGFEMGNFKRKIDTQNYHVLPWPTDEGREQLSNLIKERYDAKNILNIPSTDDQNKGTIFESVVRMLLDNIK